MSKYKLEEICFMQSGGTPKRSNPGFYNGHIPWVTISDFKNSVNDVIYETEESITQEGIEAIGNRLFKKGTLLLAMYGSIGKTAITGADMSTNQAILGITPRDPEQLNISFLKYWLDYYKPIIQSQGQGATLNNISLTIVKRQEIDLPDLDTQNNIVAILDKAHSLVKKREETIAKYDELLRATFLEMFGDPKERHSRWNTDSIGANLQNIIAGTSYGGEEKDSLDDDELGVLKISAVTKGIFNPKEFKTVKKEILKKEPVFPKEGDLLFSRANTLELVGATCIVDKDYNHLFLPDKIWKVITDESKLKRVYLHFVLQSKSIRESFINIATGSSGSMLNISMDKFKSIRIPVPPIELQEKFETFYDTCRANIEKLNSSQHEMELLQKALSQQAFIGKSQFDIDLEIEALLTSFSLEDKKFKNKRTVVNVFNTITRDQTYFQRILDKLDEQEYKEASLYNKAKGIIFRALNKNINRIQQIFVERDNTKRVKLTVNEIIET